jgi:hypothetical protein
MSWVRYVNSKRFWLCLIAGALAACGNFEGTEVTATSLVEDPAVRDEQARDHATEAAESTSISDSSVDPVAVAGAGDMMEALTGLGLAFRQAEFPAPALDPRFRPRGSPEVKAGPREKRKMGALLEQRWPEQAREENPEKLRRRWGEHTRESPEDRRERFEAALSIRSEDPAAQGSQVADSAGPAPADVSWEQMGAGIEDRDGVHHKAGRIRQAQYAFDHSQGMRVLYLGSSSGGLWKAVFAGFFALWVPISDTLPGSPSVGAFAVHPSDSNKMLIGSGDSYRYGGTGMYRTTNGGSTWTLSSLAPIPGAFYKIIIDRGNPDIVIASGDYGLWRSTDFGITWTRVYTGGTTDLVQDPVYHNYWYAGAPGIGVLESSDSGLTFHPIGGNGGNGITDPVGRISLAVSDSAPNYVYAVAEGNFGLLGGIYRSSNYGYDWVRIDSVDTISWGQAFHTTAIGVDPTTPDRLFVGMGGVQWTGNATAAAPCWTRNAGGGCTGCSSICVDGGHADFTGFIFVPGSTSVIMTNDGGYYSYDWSTNTINGLGNRFGLNVQQSGSLASARMDPEILLSGLQDNGMIRHVGGTWQFLGGGDGGPSSISPNNTNDFFFSSGAAFWRFFSTNRGNGWSNVNCAFPNNWAPTVLRDPTPGLGLAEMFTHTDDYLWYKPVSTACNWAKINNGNPLPAGFAVKAIDQNNNVSLYVFYATAWGHGSVYVLEGGSVGSLVPVDRTPPLPPGSSMNDANVTADRSSLQPNTAYYVTGGARPSRAFMTTNRGLNWENVTGDLTALLPNANYQELVANPSNLNQLYLATDQGVYRSDNRGVNWYRFMNGLPQTVNVSSIELNYDGLTTPVLHIGTYGRGYWKRTIP